MGHEQDARDATRHSDMKAFMNAETNFDKWIQFERLLDRIATLEELRDFDERALIAERTQRQNDTFMRDAERKRQVSFGYSIFPTPKTPSSFVPET